MINEQAVALVIVSKEKPRKFLLIKYNIYGQKHWDFVKGKKEKERDTAKRELKEETEIENFSYLLNSKKIKKYSYTKDTGEKVNKKVTYFLVEISNKEKIILSKEHSKFGWFDYNKANSLIKFENQKQILNEFYSKLI